MTHRSHRSLSSPTSPASRRRCRAPGCRWLHARASAALARFAQLGFPTPRDEDWKYTQRRRARKAPVRACPARRPAPSAARGRRRSLRRPGRPSLVFVNGRFAPSSRRSALCRRASTLGSLARCAATAHPDALEPLLGRMRRRPARSLRRAQHRVHARRRVHLHLARGAARRAADPPAVLSRPARRRAVDHPRNADRRRKPAAAATVVENYAGRRATAYCTNAVTEIVVGATAPRSTHYKLQQREPQAFHIGDVHAAQSRDSRFVSHSIALGGALARNDIDDACSTAEALRCTLDGLYLVGGRQHVDNHTAIDHASRTARAASSTRASSTARRAASSTARSIVQPRRAEDRRAADNKNLLLSRRRARSTPSRSSRSTPTT